MIRFSDKSDKCLTKFQSDINQTLGFFSCTSTKENIDFFNDRFDETYEKCCPIRSNTITPWITKAIKILVVLIPKILNFSNKALPEKKPIFITRTN